MIPWNGKFVFCAAVLGAGLSLGVVGPPTAPATAQQPASAAQQAPSAASAEEEQSGSLYERLGGLQPISVVVSDFIDVLVPDPVLNQNPAIDAARVRVPAEYLKYHVTAMVCEATGGPCEYEGRNMAESHAHLNITPREWQRMLELLEGVLADHAVPDPEARELIAIVQSTKDDIVSAEDREDGQEPPLYDRLGGLPALTVVVSDFIDVLVPDPVLNQNPALDAARQEVPAEYLKYHVTAMVCEATGGPCEYVGRSMEESHAHLGITPSEWERMLTLFRGVLDDHGVPEGETRELLAIVASTRPDIVTAQD